MAKEYNIGDRLYLPVWVTEKETNVMMGPDKSTTITDAKFSYAYWHGKTGEGKVRYGEPGLLLTTEEVAEEYKDKAQRKIETLTKQLEEANETIKAFSESEDIVRTNFDAKVDENRELKARNAELEALLKEVMATRDEAIRQNDELITKNNELEDANCNLTKACSEWQIAAQTCADNAKVADKATEELRKENKDLKAKAAENADTISRLSANKVALTEEVGRLRETIADRTIDVQHLTEENDKLKTDLDQRNKDFDAMKKDRDNILADSKRTTEWYMEANRTATEATEANDDLKAKIAELRDEVATLKAERCSLNGHVGKNLAEIQALSSDVHFFKEACKKQKAECDELKGRYDELDSVNNEQAEKIRKLDAERDTWERNAKAWKMTADGMSKRAEELQAENEKLNNRNKYLESEKNRKPIVHVLTNDGHVYAFTSSGKVSVKYHTELNILMIEDGEKTIAGFSRGDKPGNLSAWWMG